MVRIGILSEMSFLPFLMTISSPHFFSGRLSDRLEKTSDGSMRYDFSVTQPGNPPPRL